MERQTSRYNKWLMQLQQIGFFWLVLVAGVELRAFEIRTPQSDGCHESMVLESMKINESMKRVLQVLSDRARGVIPSDMATRGFVREFADRFQFHHLPQDQQYVLASLVAGVREPDTEGFAIIDFNNVRSTHIQDQRQRLHFLRDSTMDEVTGNTSAVRKSRQTILDLAVSVAKAWWSEELAVRRVRWTFPFYGERDILVFAPAYDLGVLAHVIQDSYSHTLRDSTGRILAVLNYVDVMNENHSESRDGPAHSDRLDRCQVGSDEFDRERFNNAIHDTAMVMQKVMEAAERIPGDLSSLSALLDSIFVVAEGCVLANQYCDSEWYAKSLEDLTAPLSVALCGRTTPPNGREQKAFRSGGWIHGLMLFAPFLLTLGVWVFLRLRRRLEFKSPFGHMAFACFRSVVITRVVMRRRGLFFFLIGFLSLSLFSLRALALQDPTGGKPFFNWVWQDQFLPTYRIASEPMGIGLFLGGTTLTAMSHQYDSQVREAFHEEQFLSGDLAKVGSQWGSGLPGIVISGVQIVFDQEAGLAHARSIAFTSLSHVTLMFIVARERPSSSERMSFPSGHTASAFATATSLAYSYGYQIGVPAFALAGLVAAGRISDDVHWLSDTVGGACLGMLWGRASARVQERRRAAREDLRPVSVQMLPVPVAGGLGVRILVQY